MSAAGANGAARGLPGLVLMFAVGLLLNLPLILNPGYYHQDEFELLARVTGRGLGELPFASFIPGDALFYRPLAYNAELVLLWALGDSPRLVHLFDAATHVLNGLLVAALAQCLLRNRRAVWIAFVAFCASPLCAHAAGWTADVYTRLWTLFGLAFTLLLLRWQSSDPAAAAPRRIAALAALVCLALASKETALVLLPGVVVFGLFSGFTPLVRRTLVVTGLLTIAFLALRAGPLLEASGAAPEDSYYGSSLGANVLANLAKYFAFPFALHARGPTNVGASIAPLVFAFGCVVHIALVAGLLRIGRRPAVLYSLAYVLPLGPVLVLHQVNGTFLYASGAALALGIAALTRLRPPALGLCAAVAFAVLLGYHGLRVQADFHQEGRIERQVHGELQHALAGNAPVPAIDIEIGPGTRHWVVRRLFWTRSTVFGTAVQAWVFRVRALDGRMSWDACREGTGWETLSGTGAPDWLPSDALRFHFTDDRLERR